MVATATPKIAVYFGNGDGTFQCPVLSTTSTLATSVAVSDLNGDGKLDLIVG